MPKTIEQYLDEVKYSLDPDYIPSDFALEFINFIKLVNGAEGEENESPILHYRMLDKLTVKSQYILNMLFRGSAKTTLFAEYFFLYLATYGSLPDFGKVNLCIYVSDSIDNGVKNMRKNLEFRYEESDFLQRYVPHIRLTDVRWEFKNADGNPLIVKGYGAKTGVRGTKELGKRPQIAVLDDLISDEDARSDTVIEKVTDTVNKAIDFALHPTKSIVIWNGTPFNRKDPLYKAAESGAWAVNVFPVCENFPCTKEEFIGAWPDRFPYEAVKAKYDKLRMEDDLSSFNQELMLKIISDEERVIQDGDVLWYNRSKLIQNKGMFNWYITTDFATSAKQKADFSVIFVWAYNSNGDWFLVEAVVKKQLMDKNIRDLFNLAQTYRPEQVGVEVSGQQGGFIPWIQEKMLERNIWFNFASDNNSNQPGIRPITDKMKRFNVVLPWFKGRKMYFPTELKDTEEIVEVMNELSLITKEGFRSKNDDCIDGISQLSSLQPWKPSAEMPIIKNDSNDIWADLEDEEPDPMSSYIV